MATIPAASKVGTSCKVSTKKKGKATITARAMDGSGKTAKVKLNVTPFESDRTPAPTESPDPRKYTTIEDFESYDVGTTWTKYTSRGKNAGKMTVVQDPENAENKCLKVEMNGTEAAFDFAPAFSVDLSKLKDSDGNSTEGRALKNYSTIRADWRVIGNDSDVTYKKIFCYFDQLDAIKTTDAFATSDNKTASAHVHLDGTSSTPVAAGADNETREVRFGLEIPMAEGADKETGITLANGSASKENGKYMPTYHTSVWQMEDLSKHYIENSCTLGYKMAESDDIKAGFATRNLVFDTARINEADATLLDQSKFDVVIGSTYKGDSQLNTGATTGQTVFYYVDNVALVEDDIPITGFEITSNAERLGNGSKTGKISVTYTPGDTTQKGIVWTVDNDKVTVDSEGNITVAEDFVFDEGTTEKQVVITATSSANPSLTKSVTITVYQVEKASADYKLDFSQILSEPERDAEGNNTDSELKVWSDVTPVANEDGSIVIPYTSNAGQVVVIDLGEAKDLSSYEGITITANVPVQIALELYDEDFDLRDGDWYKPVADGGQLRWAQYPFFNGSCVGREEDGTNSGVKGTETLSFKWEEGDITGDITKIRYVAIKSYKQTLFKKQTFTVNEVLFNAAAED